MVAHEAPTRSPEKTKKVPEIPKSREIFTGDINDAVIAVQQITGFEITPEWWMSEVGNDGTTEEILDRFDNAFEKFVLAEMGIDSDEESDPNEVQLAPSEIVAEAESEVAEFDDAVIAEPGLEPLRDEFLDALKEHLEEKYVPEVMDDKTTFEYRKYAQIFEKTPISEHELAFEQSGIEVIACGRPLEAREVEIIKSAIEKIVDVVGEEEARRLFAGIKLYAGEGLIEGGGLALPRFDSVVIDLEKFGISVAEMEEMLSKSGQYASGDQSRLVSHPEVAEASELGIVHEFGHILEYRIHGDLDVAYAALSRKDSPTMYGGKAPREDYAESWMYFIYGGDIDSERRRIIESDIA